MATLTAVTSAALVARKNTVLPLLGVMAAACSNVILDYVLVGILGMGVAGAAYATSISQFVCATIVITATVKRRHIDGFGSWKYCKSISMYAAPIIFVTTSVLSIFSALIIVANQISVTTSAAHRVLGSLFSITSLCGDPLMQAAQAFLPVYLLNNDRRSVKKLLSLILAIGLSFSIIAGTACLAVAQYFPFIFTIDASVIQEIRRVLPIFSVASFVVIPCKILYGVALAAKELGFLTILVVTGTAIFMGQLTLLLRSGTGGYGALWGILSLYYIIAIISLRARFSNLPLIGRDKQQW